jgi:hypothetical protein
MRETKMPEGDEIAGEADRLIRAAVMAGSQLAERLARARADRDRQIAGATQEANRQSELQYGTHRDIARTVHKQAADPAFWEKAGPDRIGLTFAAAYEWREHDPHAAASLAVLKVGLADHYGIDVDKTLAGTMEHLDAGQLDVARKVMGPYMTMEADSMTRSGLERRNRDEALAHALSDRSHAGADDVSAANERSDAASLRTSALDQEQQGGIGAGDGARQEAGERELVAEAYERYGAADRDHAGYDQAAVELAERRGASTPYAAYRVGDSLNATPHQEAVRIAVGESSPTSARDAMTHGSAARARVVRGATRAPGTSQELGR